MTDRPQHIIHDFANIYSPLSFKEEQELVKRYDKDNPEGNPELFLELIKHNARMIIQFAYKWQNTLDVADCLSISIQALHKFFYERWDYKSKFSINGIYAVRSALRTAQKNYSQLSSSDDEIILKQIQVRADHYNDLPEVVLEQIQNTLDPEEAAFIVDIYFNNLTLLQAGKKHYNHTYRKASSYKHKLIIDKLYLNEELKNQKEVHYA